MKIALINFESEGGYLPLATAYLAGYIREKGFKDIVIIDRANILEEVKKHKLDLIGIGIYSSTYYEANKLIKEIKKFHNVPVIAGGPHIYSLPEQIKTSNFDVGVYGEGEVTFYELVKLYNEKGRFDIKDFRKIDGLVFVNEKGKLEMTKPRAVIENLDEIPFPAIDLLKVKEHYALPGPAGANLIGIRGYVLTSRGCPYNCVYCASKAIWKGIRWHSPERTVAEIEMWVKKYNATHIYTYDDLFSANKQRLKKIIQLLEEKNLLGKVDFEILGRANLIDEEMCKILKKLNVSSLGLGLESGSNRILKYLKGNSVTVEQGKHAIDLLHKYGIKITGLFMIGNPYETEEDLKKTLEMAKNPKIDVLHIGFSIPFPGTQFWEYAVKNKIYPANFYETGKFITPDSVDFDYRLSRDISKDVLEKYWNELTELALNKVKNYSPKFSLKQLKIIMSMRLLGKLWRRRDFIKLHWNYFINTLKKRFLV